MHRAQYHLGVITYHKMKKGDSCQTVGARLLAQVESKNLRNKMYLIVTMRNVRVWVYSLTGLSSDTLRRHMMKTIH